MKRLALLAACTLPLLATACRIGSGFDSEGRLAAQPRQTTSPSEPAGKASPDTANKTDAAALPAPVVYLVPAG